MLFSWNFLIFVWNPVAEQEEEDVQCDLHSDEQLVWHPLQYPVQLDEHPPQAVLHPVAEQPQETPADWLEHPPEQLLEHPPPHPEEQAPEQADEQVVAQLLEHPDNLQLEPHELELSRW